MNKQVGIVSNKIIKILGLNYEKEQPIFIGEANINHIKSQHPKDFEKYGCEIKEIIKNPTYLARNEKKKSIEFIKKYKIDNEFYIIVHPRPALTENILFSFFKQDISSFNRPISCLCSFSTESKRPMIS